MSTGRTPTDDGRTAPTDDRQAGPSRRRRTKVWWILGGIIVVLGLIALPVFQPWKLVVDQTVNEPLPTAPTGPAPASAAATPSAPAAPSQLSTGQLVSQEHDTTGTVTIFRLPDGQRLLRLSNFSTSNGPDLHVWLSDQKLQSGTEGWFVFDDGQHVDLGGLKGNIGDQNYVIPAEVDLGRYPSVSIWCQRFSVSFGAAELVPV